MRFIAGLMIVLTLGPVALATGLFERANADSLQIADNAALDLSYATGFTICAWAKLTSVEGSGNNCVFHFTDGTRGMYVFYLESTDQWKWGSAAGVAYTALSIDSGAASEWSHVAISGYRDGSTEHAIFWLNGAEIADMSSTTGVDLVTTAAWIGRNHTGNYLMDGKIAEFAVYADALTHAEMTSLQTDKPSDVNSPAVYLPMRSDPNEDILGLAVTNADDGVTFTTADHPIDYPSTKKKVLWLTKPSYVFFDYNDTDKELLGSDQSDKFTTKLQDGNDYIAGTLTCLQRLTTERPDIGIEAEEPAYYLLPYCWFTYQGNYHYVDRIGGTYDGAPLNHPLWAALVGSYSWSQQDNRTAYLADRASARLACIPQLSITGDWDANITADRYVISQNQAVLFCDNDLFNDLPSDWGDTDTNLAWYRSYTGGTPGNWWKFVDNGDDTGSYIEMDGSPGGTAKLTIDL